MSLRVTKRRALFVTAAIGFVSVSLLGATANATQLPNDLNALNCKIYKIDATHEIQGCTTPEWGPPQNLAAAADVTAYKKVDLYGSKQWVQDNSIHVNAETTQLFVNGQAALGGGYPSGPENGYAITGARGYYPVDGPVYVYSTGVLQLIKNGAVVHSINVQSYTVKVS